MTGGQSKYDLGVVGTQKYLGRDFFDASYG